MTDAPNPTPDDDDWDIEKAREKLRPKAPGAPPKHDNSKAARKKRQQKLADAVDGRSLRASGRTEQFNFKALPGLKARAQKAAAAEGKHLAIWMEETVEAALAKFEEDSPPDA